MDDEHVFDCMGRVNLPDPDDQALVAAAGDVLGDAAETDIEGVGRLFRSTVQPDRPLYFVAPAGDPVGVLVTAAPHGTKMAVMDEAAAVRAARDDVERAKYVSPGSNPFIKTD